MTNIGIVRKLDELGRIVLPVETRRLMELQEKDSVELFINDETEQIILRKYRTQECVFCSSMERITYFRGRFICFSCLSELSPAREAGVL
ncbi:AbrB/MazE/SpoVT family DNA-binding domain-containing protein [Paenibacillus aceti]|uniref:AbrB family transcriptional regulator n=1 Tax=Paenibacillus aceti TaxID=1820010 RepID=A0ABQ1VVY5_9BACL|nr:AbrB/MazE/SpoVT family DNA-binding domain-containing protein [Paenibacillus aceti]GGG02003.1 AbrB family transcriptional regulator [Paenibacillus aceti]